MGKNVMWLVAIVALVGLGAGRFIVEGRLEATSTPPALSPSPVPTPAVELSPGPAALDVIDFYFKSLAARRYLDAYRQIVPFHDYEEGTMVMAGWSNERFEREWTGRNAEVLGGYVIKEVTRPGRDRLDAMVHLANGEVVPVELIRHEGRWYLFKPPILGLAEPTF